MAWGFAGLFFYGSADEPKHALDGYRLGTEGFDALLRTAIVGYHADTGDGGKIEACRCQSGRDTVASQGILESIGGGIVCL